MTAHFQPHPQLLIPNPILILILQAERAAGAAGIKNRIRNKNKNLEDTAK